MVAAAAMLEAAADRPLEVEAAHPLEEVAEAEEALPHLEAEGFLHQEVAAVVAAMNHHRRRHRFLHPADCHVDK